MRHRGRLSWIRRSWRLLRVTWRLLRDRRVPWHLKLIPAAGLAYALWPADLLPDALTIIGLTDDLAVLALSLTLFHRLVPHPLLHHHTHQ